MTWQIAISLSIIANVITSIVQRHYSLKSTAPATFPPAVSYLLGVTPLGIIVGLILPHHVHWTWWILYLFTWNSLTIAIANWLRFKAVKRMPVGQFQVINQFYEIVVIILGWIFLREGLNLFQVFGAMLLFAGALIAIRAPSSNRDLKALHFQTVNLTLLATTLFGISLVIEKAALAHMNIGAYLIFGWSAQTIAMLVLALKDTNKKTLREFRLNELRWSAIMGWANASAGVLYVIAIVRSNNISLITALTAVALPLITISAYFILKERENLRLVGASVALSVLGLLVTSLH
jgi:drug/metabolite transporter (DMT)-like permease